MVVDFLFYDFFGDMRFFSFVFFMEIYSLYIPFLGGECYCFALFLYFCV